MIHDQYFVLEPEVAGELGEGSVLDHSTRPVTVVKLEYHFMGWLGDDLLTTHPCFIVTHRLMEALQAFAGTGYSFDYLKVSKDEQFDEMHPGISLPQFAWMKTPGIAGADDVGLRPNGGSLVVSHRLLSLLRQFKIDNCLVRKKPYRVKP